MEKTKNVSREKKQTTSQREKEKKEEKKANLMTQNVN